MHSLAAGDYVGEQSKQTSITSLFHFVFLKQEGKQMVVHIQYVMDNVWMESFNYIHLKGGAFFFRRHWKDFSTTPFGLGYDI